jgi:DNA polymerase IV
MSKASFFAALEDLDDSDDEQPDAGLSFQNILAASRPFHDLSDQAAAVEVAPNPPSLIRANTEPQSSSEQRSQHLTEIQRNEHHISTKLPEPKVRAVKRSNTTGTMPGITSKGSSTKKRKADALKSVPDEQQVFKGLVFCMKTYAFVSSNPRLTPTPVFIPNDDIAPARRLRIQRAREYGAQWTRQWGSHITHVVAEKRLTYQNLIDYLKLGCFPVRWIFPKICRRAANNRATEKYSSCQRKLPS